MEACIVLVVLGDENVEMAAGLSLSKVEGGLVYNYKPIQLFSLGLVFVSRTVMEASVVQVLVVCKSVRSHH